MNTAGIIEIIVTLPTGIVCVVLGLLLWKKQMIKMVHEYHYKNVKPQDVPAYTRLWGIALVMFGVCVGLTGLINVAFSTETGWILFGIGFVILFFIGNKAQKKYNGAWFS